MEEKGSFTEKKFSLGKFFQISAYGLTPLMKWAKGDLTDTQINLEDPNIKQSVNNQANRYKRTALIYACRSLQPLNEILRKVKTLIAMGADSTLRAEEVHDTNYAQPDGSYEALDYINQQKGDAGTLEMIRIELSRAPLSESLSSSSS